MIYWNGATYKCPVESMVHVEKNIIRVSKGLRYQRLNQPPNEPRKLQ
jgi:hypothetical protein